MTPTSHLLLQPKASERLPTLLGRIRAHREPLVILECSGDARLQQNPLLRRLLRAAAADLGKELVFRFGLGSGDVHAIPAARPETRASVRGPGTPLRQGYGGQAPLLRTRPSEVRRTVEADAPAARSLPADADARPRAFGSGRPPRYILPLFTLIAGSVLALVVLFVLPRARVTIAVTEEPLATDLVLRLDATTAAPHGASGTFPARHVVIDEEVSDEFSTETVEEKGERARGVVELVNDTVSPQPIRAQTRAQSASGLIVRTQRGVIIPPKGRASVAVVADVGGTAGNLEPQRLTLPGLPPESQRLILAEIVAALNGGTDRPIRVVAVADIDRATEAIRDKVEERIAEQLRTEVTAAGAAEQRESAALIWLHREDLSRIVVERVRATPAVGAEAERFRLTAEVRAEAFTADERALREFLLQRLQGRTEEEKTVPEDAINLDDLRVIDVRWDDRWAELSLHVETTVVPALHVDALKDRLAGRSAADAEAFFRNLPGVRAATVVLSPVWVKHIPGNPRNVHIQVGRPGE